MRALPFDMPAARDVLAGPRGRRSLLGAAAAGIDTVRVLLLRVSFASDRLDALTTLSTGGGFDLAPAGGSVVDPTPHDRAYFESHLCGLASYYRFQSCGRLEVAGTVAPAGPGDSYVVSDPADYGPGRAGSWTAADLVRFFRDCVKAADDALAAAGYPVRFADYDAVVVAHAGANLQSDVDGDTPNDIPSFFASLAPESAVPVDGGAAFVRDGCVISETSCQDDLVGGIAGVFAHEFGHQLGLPDLYNTRAGTTSVGYWDLMDAGTYLGALLRDRDDRLVYAEGFLPGGLSAWTRSLLGWVALDTIAAAEEAAALPAVERCPPRAVELRHAGDEVFVIENRCAELDGEPTYLVRDPNGVIVGTANCENCDVAPEDPVWEYVNGYDLLLPIEALPAVNGGPGILVWRVDERLVAERRPANAINALSPRGVTLLEANGVPDLGRAGSPYAYGWYDDAYFGGNNADLDGETVPSSISSWGVPTGAEMRLGGQGRDTLMRFTARVRGVAAAAPMSAGPDPAAAGILCIPGSERILLVDAVGTGRLLGGDTVFAVGRAALGPPAFTDRLEGTTGPAVILGETAGYVHAFAPGSWSEPPGWPASISASLAAHPVVVKGENGDYVAAAGRASIHALGGDGEELPGSPITFFDGDVASNVAVAENAAGLGSAIYFALAGNEEPPRDPPRVLLHKWRFDPEGSEALRPAPGYPKRLAISTADLAEGLALAGGDLVPSEEGDEVFVVCRATGRVLTVGGAGTLADRPGAGPVREAPAIGDLNGDSYLDLVYSDGNSIVAVNPSGANVTGWPRRIASLFELPWPTLFASPITIGASSTGATVAAGSDGGMLYLFEGNGILSEGTPLKTASSIDRAIEMRPWSGVGELALVDGGLVRVRESAGGYDASLSWHTLWGNPGRSAWLREGGGSGPGDWSRLASDLVVYPNPSRGDRVRFHFTAPPSGTARLEIMTLEGDLVLAREKTLRGGEDEFAISMADRAPGVYLARIVIASGGRSAQTVKTFAVVR